MNPLTPQQTAEAAMAARDSLAEAGHAVEAVVLVALTVDGQAQLAGPPDTRRIWAILEMAREATELTHAEESGLN
jgi:hypothetical protein